MALFDANQFDPASFRQQLPGWLTQLLGGQQNVTPSQGFAPPTGESGNGIDPAGYQYGPGGRQAWLDYPNSVLPQNAQPVFGSIAAQQPQQQQQQQASPDFGGRLSAGLEALTQPDPGGLLGVIGNAVKGFSGGQSTSNQTAQMLVRQGMDPQMAQVVVKNPQLLQAYIVQSIKPQGTNDIREYTFAKSQGFTGSFEQWIQRKRVGAGEYSLTPVYGTDDQGNTVLVQPGKSGEAIQTKLPAGVKISSGIEKLDLGTQWGIVDKRTGNIVGYQPKDIVGKEAAGERGKEQGKAQAILPQTKTAVESAVKVIDELRNHPGIDVGTGLSTKIDPRSLIPGQAGYDFKALNEQAQGKAFMTARESLKGAGQVTDFEGKKGEQAIANLNTAQSKPQYLKALAELERMLNASYADLQRKAGQAPAAPAAVGPSTADPMGIRK